VDLGVALGDLFDGYENLHLGSDSVWPWK